MPTQTRQWLLNGHPRGRGIEDCDFRLVEAVLPNPKQGEMLVKTRWLGFDPAQKGWMENIADYVAPMAIDDVMRGSGIGEVTASNGGRFTVGNLVFGTSGWTENFVIKGKDPACHRPRCFRCSARTGSLHIAGCLRPAGRLRATRCSSRAGRGDRLDRRAARQDHRLPRGGHRRRPGQVRLAG